MQARGAAVQEAPAEAEDHLMTEGADRRDVVAHGLQTLADPARDLGAASVGEAGELGEVGDRHDAGQDGDVDA